VRGLAGDHRDPAGAIQQDNCVNKVRDVTSALPYSTATAGDQNKDACGSTQNRRGPAGAIQQDKAAGGFEQRLPCMTLLHWHAVGL
jgi:hypothetical protein